mgnify:FL=1
MKAFSFTLLIIYLLSLSSAYADLCVDRLGPLADRFETSKTQICDDQDADSSVEADCCGTRDNDSDNDCGSCPCLCHAVAAVPGHLSLNMVGPSSNAIEADFSVISIHHLRIDRPPRLS